MKRASAAFVFILVITLSHVGAQAQAPSVTVYFDANLQQTQKSCPGDVLDTLYVAASDFLVSITGIEYKILFPAGLTWVADLNTPTVTIGDFRLRDIDGVVEPEGRQLPDTGSEDTGSMELWRGGTNYGTDRCHRSSGNVVARWGQLELQELRS